MKNARTFILDVMMILAVICVLVLLFFYPAKAHAQTVSDPNEWTTANTVMELSFYAVCFVDYKQTRYMAQNNWHNVYSSRTVVNASGSHVVNRYYQETNPILGKHPSNQKLLAFGLSSCVIQTTISYFLPHTYRELFQGFSVGIETANVIRNHNIKIPFSCVWSSKY
jgi:hypothetical protein